MKAALRILIVFSLVWSIARTAIYLLPGDPAEYLVHESLVQVSPEVLREKMGIPQHGWQRIFSFPQTHSLIRKESTFELVSNALSRSATLTFLTLLMSSIITCLMLYLSFRSAGAKTSLRILSSISASIPLFVAGPLLLLIFCVWLKIFSPIESPFLPAVTLSFYLCGFWYRALGQKLDTYLPESSVSGARSRGASEARVFFKNLLAPSLGSFLAYFGTQLGILLNGSLLVEIIFQWHGIGSLLAESVLSRDYPVIELCLFSVTLLSLLSQQLGYFLQEAWEPKHQ